MRCASWWQAADVIDEEKEKVAEVRRLTSRKMSETEEMTAEVRWITYHNMAYMEDKAVDMAFEMAHEMRRATHFMKAEMKNMKVEAYDFLSRKREKVKINAIS